MTDLIKEAFQKAKEDIFYLGNELNSLKQDILDIKTEISLFSSFLEDFKLKNYQFEQAIFDKIAQISEKMQFLHENQHSNTQTNQQTNTPTHKNPPFPTDNPTLRHIIPTENPIPTDNPTHPQEIEGLITPYKPFSIGNEGVPTDKPTDRQTNQQIIQHIPFSQVSEPISLDKAQELLASLDSLKKEVRFKFKRLTPQEMQVFSLLYSLEEQGNIVDYKLISDNLKLSESSIRDYVHKLQKKGIPITKEKLNNKRVLLHISQDLKKIASLQTILKLREL